MMAWSPHDSDLAVVANGGSMIVKANRIRVRVCYAAEGQRMVLQQEPRPSSRWVPAAAAFIAGLGATGWFGLLLWDYRHPFTILTGVFLAVFAVVYVVQIRFQAKLDHWAKYLAFLFAGTFVILAPMPALKVVMDAGTLGRLEVLLDNSPWLAALALIGSVSFGAIQALLQRTSENANQTAMVGSAAESGSKPTRKDGLGAFREQRAKLQADEAVLRDTVSRILRGDTVRSVTSENGKVFQVGDRFPVPSHRWIEVVNLEPLKSGNSAWEFGDRCSINKEGSLEILGFMEAANGWQALVRYYIPNTAFGACCSDGTLSFLEL